MTLTPRPPRIRSALDEVTDPGFDDDESWEDCCIEGSVDPTTAGNVKVLGSLFRHARLTGATLPGLTLRDCRFENCELSGAMFDDASLTRVEFVDCRLSGTVLSNSRLSDVRFVDCRADALQLRMAAIGRSELARSTLPGADFYSTKMEDVSFFDCDLGEADFSAARLTDVRVHGSDLVGILGGNALRRLTIDSTQVIAMARVLFEANGIVVDDDRS